jgi:hypothetical protein
MRNQSLTELHARLGAMIEENNRRGWQERNELPAYIQINQEGRRSPHYFPVAFVSSAQLGFSDNEGEPLKSACVIETHEARGIKPYRERSRKIAEKSRRRILTGIKPVIHELDRSKPDDSPITWVDFGQHGRTAAKLFVEWLKKETAWTSPKRSRNAPYVWLYGADKATLQALVDEFMAL